MDQTIKNEIPDENNKGALAMTLQKVMVYELAKELGMDSISLLEKLKSLQLDVKSHMSALGPEEVKTVKDHIAKEQALLTKATKKTAKTTTKATTKTVAGLKTSKTTKTAKVAKEAELAPPKKSTATVIRRRVKSEGEESAPESAVASSQIASIEATEAVQSDDQALSELSQETSIDTLRSEIKIVSEADLGPVQESPDLSTTEAKQLLSSVSKIVVTSRAAPKPTKSEQDTTGLKDSSVLPDSFTQKSMGIKIPSLLGARSEGKGVVKSKNIINLVRSEEPARVIAPKGTTPDPRLMMGPTTSPGGRSNNAGIINIGKDAIDRMTEEEQRFKKKIGNKAEREGAVDIKVSDYRAKKELIFLPKKKKVPQNKEIRRTQLTTPAAHKRVVRIENSVTVSELASRMGVKSGELIKKLMGNGVMATLNHVLDLDTATLLATEYGFEIENVAFKEESIISLTEDKAEDLKPRPPIVTIMGHVDHGKTSLLDTIRSANVAGGEAGGITQHIGAYTVEIDGKKITFIDTPGHEAFTTMRSRGANVTDIVILVVAADDGVMPQTKEAIDHARAANVPIIVAVNKIDKQNANPDRVLKGLSELNLVPEAWGGDSIFVNVSALKKTGIKELLEAILLQAEVLDLKANPDRLAEGSVLEAKLDRAKGPLVTVLVKKGTLKSGDVIVAGPYVGRVRAMVSAKGEQLKQLCPSEAAELLGLEGVPTAGDAFNAMKSEAEAREVAEHRLEKIKNLLNPAKSSKMTLEELFGKVQQGEVKELPVLIKADVFGSSEALKDSLSKLATEKVKLKILHTSTGGITESDVMLASASNAIILGFNVRPETKAIALAEAEKVEIKTYTIIYELLDDVKKAMAGILDKQAIEKYLGRAEVRDTFSVPKMGVIAGSFVVDGKIVRGCQVRLLRDNRVIYTGKLSSLKRFKDDAKEVAQGYECGMGIENFNDIKQGDVIEAFLVEMIAQEIGSAISEKAV